MLKKDFNACASIQAEPKQNMWGSSNRKEIQYYNTMLTCFTISRYRIQIDPPRQIWKNAILAC